jgi:hypothetical protein
VNIQDGKDSQGQGGSSSHFETDDIDELMGVDHDDGANAVNSGIVEGRPIKPGGRLKSPGIRKTNLDNDTDVDASDVEHAHV